MGDTRFLHPSFTGTPVLPLFLTQAGVFGKEGDLERRRRRGGDRCPNGRRLRGKHGRGAVAESPPHSGPNSAPQRYRMIKALCLGLISIRSWKEFQRKPKYSYTFQGRLQQSLPGANHLLMKSLENYKHQFTLGALRT